MGRGRLGEVAGVAPLPIIFKPLDANAPSVKVWNAIDAADKRIAAKTGTPLLDPTPKRALQLYLTTEATAKQLKSIAEVGTDAGVSFQLASSVKKVYPHLPEELRREYETPKKLLRTRSGKRLDERRINVKRGYSREFSPDHHNHLSEGQLRRWKRYREEDKPQGKRAFSEQGLANIHAHSGRRRITAQESS